VRPLALFLLALLLGGLQAALLRHLGGGVVTVCLLAPVLVHLALTAANVDGAVGAAAVGYVLDLLTGTPKGLMTFLSVGVFLAVRFTGAAVDLRGRVGFALLSGAAALGLSAGAVALQRLVSSPEAAPGWGVLPRVLAEAAATALVAPLLQLLVRRLDTLLGGEEPDLIG
jgi:rod shape-determining protein MreD